VAGDNFRFAMPEVSIGFFPDVGATWFLPRLPGEIGTFCALTGERIGAGEAVAAGVATHRISSARFPELSEALCGAVSVDAILSAFSDAERWTASDGEAIDKSVSRSSGDRSAPVGLLAHRGAIDRIFAANRVEDILASLDALSQPGENEGGESDAAQWSRATAAGIRTKAPLSLKIALAQMRHGRGWSFEECMQAEFRIVSRVAYGEDFYEGIRAVIIDKDNLPHWRPPTLCEVTDQMVAGYFAPLAVELKLS
jgi:enoyl-CoA hydratase